MPEDADIYVGLDMGVNSPSLSVLNLCTVPPSWSTYIWPQRATDMNVRWSTTTRSPLEWYRTDDQLLVWKLPSCQLSIQVAPGATYDAKHKTANRMIRVLDKIPSMMAILDAIQTAHPDAKWSLGIEQYAMGTSKQHTLAHLAEAAGVVKYECARRGWFFKELATTSIKLAFGQTGIADKAIMLEAWKRALPTVPDLYTLFRVKPNAKNDVKPIQDLVDAFAVCMTLATRDPFPIWKTVDKKRKLVYAKSRVTFGPPPPPPPPSSILRKGKRKRPEQTPTTNETATNRQQPPRKRQRIDPPATTTTTTTAGKQMTRKVTKQRRHPMNPLELIELQPFGAPHP